MTTTEMKTLLRNSTENGTKRHAGYEGATETLCGQTPMCGRVSGSVRWDDPVRSYEYGHICKKCQRMAPVDRKPVFSSRADR
jgi:hypothetical protein